MAPTFDEALREKLKAGWTVKSDGPSGVQLEAPKKMKSLDKGAAVLGAALVVFVPPLGGLLIVAAVVDYAFLTKPETMFVARK